jgi:hypothetical protein
MFSPQHLAERIGAANMTAATAYGRNTSQTLPVSAVRDAGRWLRRFCLSCFEQDPCEFAFVFDALVVSVEARQLRHPTGTCASRRR